MGLLRFHWDFFGPDALNTANHFREHLEQFCTHEGITGHRHWSTGMPRRCIATLECGEEHLVLVRDRLKPKRAERVLD
ncbi:MAG: hypothetical protein KDB88_11170 [Flavobacteriales bacterium]|nr:hypothetical protein [Flavobacteriales bacterium]